MDSNRKPGIRIQRSVSVTSGATRRGTSSSSSHCHHLHSGGRARATSSASISDAVFESMVGGGDGGGGSVKRRRHRSLPYGTPPQTLADDGGGCDKDAAIVTTAVAAPARRAGSVVLPSPRSSVLPRPKGHEARMRMIIKQQREVQEIRELAEFLRNRTPPPENFMSRPDDAMSSRSASPEPPKSRSQLARRWCALKSVFALRRRKVHKDEQKGRARRASADLAPTTITTAAIAHPLPRRPKTAQFKLPDSAVAGTTIAGHRHIAISIPVQHSHLGPEPKSQYPVYAPGEDRGGGGLFLSPPHAAAAAAELDAAQQDGDAPWPTALGPVSEGRESGDDAASRSPLSSPGYHTPIGMSASPVPGPTATATTITATPPARVVMVRNPTPPSDLRGGQAAPTTAASEARQHPTEQQQQRGKAAALEAPAPSGSPQSDSYFTAPSSLSSAPASPSDMGTFGPGRTGVRSPTGDRSVSIDRLLHTSGSDEGHEDEDAATAASDPQKRPNTNRKGKAGHHRRHSSMASRQSIADSILTDGTEPVIMTDIQTVRRISSSPSIVHRRLSAAAPRHSLPPGLAIPPLRGSEYGGGDVPVTAIRLLPSPVSSSGSGDSDQRRLRRTSRDIRNSPPLGDDGVPGTPASQRTIRPQRQAEDELYVDAPQGLARSPLTPFPTETGFVEQAEGGSGEGGDGAAFFASSSGARVGLNPVMTVSATEATTPPGSRGSLAASGAGSSRHSSVIATKRLPEFQLQPAPTRLARGNGGSSTTTASLTQSPASPARRTKSLNLAARRLVAGGGSPSVVQQRHLLAPTWPAGDQPLPPTPSSGPTPPDSPKPSKAAAVATEAPPAEEPAAAVPLSVNQSQRRFSAPVSEAAKSAQGSARKVSAQQQQEPPQNARKEQGQYTEKPKQMDRISLSRRIERRKKIAAAAAGARQAEVFAAVAAAMQAQQKQAEEKQKQQAQQEDEHEHDGGANRFYHHHYHHAAPREDSLNRQRQASIPQSASLYSASSYGRHHQQEHHHHRNPTSTSPAAAAVALLTPGKRRVEEMERRVRLLEQTGEAWLGALVPLIENLGRTLEAQRVNQHIEDCRRRRRMSSNSSVGERRQPPPPAPDAAPYGSQRERRRQASRSERPKTSGGFESYSQGSSRSVRQPADEADGEFAVRDRAASLHRPNPPISSYFGLPPSPAEREHMDAAAVRARRRSTTSTSSKRTAVLVGDFEDEVSRRLGLEDGAQQQQHSQRPRSHHGWSRQSSQGPPPRSSSAAALDEAKRTSLPPSVRSHRLQQQRPETAYGHRRELSGASAFSAASSSRLEHHSSGRTRERYDEAGIDGFHTLAPLMNELTGHGVSLEFYPKEPVRLEDEYEGDISPY